MKKNENQNKESENDKRNKIEIKNDKNVELREKEDATKYGETVPSMFAWTGLEEQKEIAKELDNATKKNKK